jgi:hypothetical protein
MKKVLMLMLGLVATTASFANEPTTTPETAQTRVVMTTGQKIKLYVQPLRTKGQVTMLDTKGQAIFTETVNLQKGLSQQFNFANLGTGTYHLTLATGTETITKTFVVQANPSESFVVQ